MAPTDLHILPASSLEETAHDLCQDSESEDVSPLRTDSNSDSLESRNSSFSTPSSRMEKTQLSLSSSKTKLRIGIQLADLFAENVVAKIFKVAVRELQKEKPPISYPEYVTTGGPGANKYTMTEASFWTCGFFPGSIYTLLERAIKYPQNLSIPAPYRASFTSHLLSLGRAWSVPIRAMAVRTDTHDMAFIIQPALRMDWELTGNTESLENLITAAHSLASRFNPTVGAIRSWDDTANGRYSFVDKEKEFLVIIDSMCNLDLLYWAGHQTSNQTLIEIATIHAHTVLRAIVRDDWSTYHLINFDPFTGAVKDQLTNQGWRDWSTWSRGQAWAILGFIQTYTWTKDHTFLDAALSLANFFLSHLAAATHSHPYVPLWDFDAPPTASSAGPLRDTSAAMIAANGLLLLHQVLVSEGREPEASMFMEALLRITRETLALSLAVEKSKFAVPSQPTEQGMSNGNHGFREAGYPAVVDETEGVEFDALLKNATANNNEFSFKRYADHGLVYADYYFLELGNKLLRMGLV